jgi:hypothetical protein
MLLMVGDSYINFVHLRVNLTGSNFELVRNN